MVATYHRFTMYGDHHSYHAQQLTISNTAPLKSCLSLGRISGFSRRAQCINGIGMPSAAQGPSPVRAIARVAPQKFWILTNIAAVGKTPLRWCRPLKTSAASEKKREKENADALWMMRLEIISALMYLRCAVARRKSVVGLGQQ